MAGGKDETYLLLNNRTGLGEDVADEFLDSIHRELVVLDPNNEVSPAVPEKKRLRAEDLSQNHATATNDLPERRALRSPLYNE